jgi:hypothetical protein
MSESTDKSKDHDGCQQNIQTMSGTEFDETVAPAVRIKSIHVLLAISAHRNLYIQQVDCNNAFLNGDSNVELQKGDDKDGDNGNVNGQKTSDKVEYQLSYQYPSWGNFK